MTLSGLQRNLGAAVQRDPHVGQGERRRVVDPVVAHHGDHGSLASACGARTAPSPQAGPRRGPRRSRASAPTRLRDARARRRESSSQRRRRPPAGAPDSRARSSARTVRGRPPGRVAWPSGRHHQDDTCCRRWLAQRSDGRDIDAVLGHPAASLPTRHEGPFDGGAHTLADGVGAAAERRASAPRGEVGGVREDRLGDRGARPASPRGAEPQHLLRARWARRLARSTMRCSPSVSVPVLSKTTTVVFARRVEILRALDDHAPARASVTRRQRRRGHGDAHASAEVGDQPRSPVRCTCPESAKAAMATPKVGMTRPVGHLLGVPLAGSSLGARALDDSG